MKNIILEEYFPCKYNTWGCKNCDNHQIKHTIGIYEGQSVDAKVGMGKDCIYVSYTPYKYNTK